MKLSLSNQGQTLIETVVALFIMVMGITAALGLANYSFNASTSIRKQIIGIGLAREGIEAIKNVRDTNWLNAQLDTNCTSFSSGGATACYRDWLNPTSGNGYNITGSLSVYLGFNAAAAASNGYWVGGGALGNPWGLNTSSDPNVGLYTPSATSTSTSGFYRQIIIAPQTTAPFNASEYNRLLVESRVWWSDKRCPVTSSWPGVGKCSIDLQTYLTNWKTY